MDCIELDILEKENVYPVSEDTLLLAEAIEVSCGQRFLEIGCATGYITLLAAKIGASAVGVDCNMDAVELSKLNASRLGIQNISFFVSNLFSEVKGTYDVIVFNPPYLPSEDFESTQYDACWDGGKNGREVSARFIDDVKSYLAENGTVYLLQSSLSGIDAIINQMEEKGFTTKICSELPLFFEKLVVIRANRQTII